ncbi:MAG: CHAT domain-containing protein [Deltaproteobacteria bacterium]|nr:CHAT domain-containing protein [Deltaproteobacteria bacterium]
MRIPRKSELDSGGHKAAGLFVSLVMILMALGIVLPDFLLASGPGGGPSKSPGRPSRGGGGIGIGIGIQIGPRMPTEDKEVDFDKIERDLMRKADPDSGDDEKPQRVRQPTPKAVEPPMPARKLVKPRVLFLTELAIDIDRNVIDLATNEPVKAVQLYKSAAAQAKSKRDLQAEKEALTNLAHVYFLTGQLARAREAYERTLEIFRKLGDSKEEAIAIRNLAVAATAAGDYDLAEEQNRNALRMFEQAGMTGAAVMVRNNLGVLEKNRGRHAAAMENYEQALAAEKERNRSKALALANIGSLARSRGEYKKAVESYTEALGIMRSLGAPREEADYLLRISQVFSDWGRYDQALENAQIALDILSKMGAATDGLRKVVGDLYLDTGRVDQAEPFLKEADYDSSLGRLYLLRQDYEAAKKHYQMLLAASQKDGNPDELFTAYVGLGKVAEATKNFKEAETNYSKALDLTEEIRSSLLLSERKNFLASKVNGFARSEPAKGLVRISLKQNKPQQGMAPSESVRAREFTDILSQNVDGVHFNVPKDLLQKEADISNRLASAKTALPIVPKAVDNERYNDISRQVKTLESQKTAFVQSLWKDHREYASVKYPKPVKIEEAVLAPNEYVVVFDVLGEGLGVRVLQGKKIVDAFLTDWKLADLETDVAKFRKAFEAVQLREFDAELARGLYTRLLARALEKIPPGSSVSIIPDGMLALVPFEALVTRGSVEWKKGKWGDEPSGLTYVGDLYPLAYYQSLTAMSLVRTLAAKKKTGDRVLVVADPVFEMQDARAQTTRQETRVASAANNRFLPLMAAIEEDSGGYFKLNRLSKTSDLAATLGGQFGSNCDVFTGLEASKNVLLSKVAPTLDHYRWLIFATHGFAGNKIPGIMEPVLALTMVPPGTDGYLTISEVVGLKMNADVAALTACQTGTGVGLAGEGIMSMGRAFQCAGARSVLMTLWSVAEDSSVMLTDRFFTGLKEGKSKRDAWRQARTEVRKAGFEHPFFWGGFILVGEAE